MTMVYIICGNVSEWVADVYRPITEQTTTSDHRPFRGNVYKTHKINPKMHHLVKIHILLMNKVIFKIH